MEYIKSHTRSYFIKYLSYSLGFIFITSAFVKIFDVESFDSTIKLFFPPLTKYSILIAFAVILTELVLGTMIFFSKFSWISIPLLISLVFLFVVLLTYNIMLGNSVHCNCFGFISGYYSLNTQLVIDIILLNSLIALLYLKDNKVNKISIKLNKKNWILAVVFYAFVNIGLFQIALSSSKDTTNTTDNFIKDISKFVDSKSINDNSIKVFFLISFTDFACPLCYDSFLEISDTLSANNKSRDIFYLFDKSSLGSNLNQEKRLDEWTKIAGINSPASYITKNIFKKYTSKSCLIVFDKTNHLIFKETFPIEPSKKQMLLSYFK